MAAVDISDYKGLYIETAREYLEALKKSLVVLERNQNDHDALNQMFISSHSLKSQSQVMNYTKIVSLSESIESLTRNLLDKHIPLDTDSFSLLKNSIGEIDLEFGKIEKGDIK